MGRFQASVCTHGGNKIEGRNASELQVMLELARIGDLQMCQCDISYAMTALLTEARVLSLW